MLKLLLSFEGRVGRAGYMVGALVVSVLPVVLFLVMYGMLDALGYGADSGADLSGAVKVALYATGALVLLSIYPSSVLAVKRLHDLGHSGWMLLGITCATIAIGNVSPGLSILLSFASGTYLSCFRGDDGPNDYGRPPSGLSNAGLSEYERVMRQVST